MDASNKTEAVGANGTTVERRSDREVVVTRWFDAPARIVFEAWSTPELFRKWWVPKSMGMTCLLYTSPSPRDRTRSRMPSFA